MGKLFFETGSGTKILTGTGRLSIQDATVLKDLLTEAYNSPGDLLIDLTGAQSLDLACIQVLCTANITYRKTGRHLGLSGMLPEGVRRSLQEIAVEPGACALESPGECLWSAGEKNG